MVQEELQWFLIKGKSFQLTPSRSSIRSDEEHRYDGDGHVWHPTQIAPVSCQTKDGFGHEDSFLPPRRRLQDTKMVFVTRWRSRGGHPHGSHPFPASEFRVYGSGFRVQGSRFRVQGSGFRVQGLGFGLNPEAGAGRV